MLPFLIPCHLLLHRVTVSYVVYFYIASSLIAVVLTLFLAYPLSYLHQGVSGLTCQCSAALPVKTGSTRGATLPALENERCGMFLPSPPHPLRSPPPLPPTPPYHSTLHHPTLPFVGISRVSLFLTGHLLSFFFLMYPLIFLYLSGDEEEEEEEGNGGGGGDGARRRNGGAPMPRCSTPPPRSHLLSSQCSSSSSFS